MLNILAHSYSRPPLPTANWACKPSRHWPIGLLYDLLTGRDPSYATTDFNSEDEHRLPWTLTLHYTDYPHEHLMRLDYPSSLQDAFINSTKEASSVILLWCSTILPLTKRVSFQAEYMRYGNSRAVMSLSMADSAKLWRSIETRMFPQLHPLPIHINSPVHMPYRQL